MSKSQTTRDAALEEAALECLVQLPAPAGEFEAGYRMACEENARNIRAMKGKSA